MIIAIAAMSENRVIGRDGGIPWKVSKDMQFFKRTTTGHVVVMGRKTYDSIGRLLPNRENIVISRNPVEIDGVRWVASPDAVCAPDDGRHVYVIGGSQIYDALMPRCDEVLLTVIKRHVDGDTFFPEFEAAFAPAQVLEADAEIEIRRYCRP
jgi:dihydrofolate reductase